MGRLPSLPADLRAQLASEVAERDRLRKRVREAHDAWRLAKREHVRAMKALLAYPNYRQICAKFNVHPKLVKHARGGYKTDAKARAQAEA